MKILLLAMLTSAVICGWYGWRLIRVETRRARRLASRRYTASSFRKRLWTSEK